ncbi:MAG: multidrug DMT transporter permease [Legionella sp.]|nr:MAG: multidrug DMT transporter permease [Legionella sp.]
MFRIMSLFFCLFSPVLYAITDKSECQKHQCMAVVDAGSSGSRLHVYAYDLDETNTPINIDEIWNRKAIPGLSAIEHEHGSVSTYMEKLFQNAPKSVMPVYFYSTAGMRLLPKTHHKDINELVADWFDKQYYWRLESARTIPGNEEGVYAWLAVNYQLKLLNQTDKPLSGVMDIGGASVQIIFPLQNEEGIDSNDKVDLDLYGQKFTLFSHSFLGLGQNEMGHQYFDLNSCYPQEYELPSGLYGKGDLDSCKNEIVTLVNSVHYVRKKAGNLVAKNNIETWHLIGGINNLLNDRFFPFSNQRFTLQDLRSFTDSNHCHQPWSKLDAAYPNNFMFFNYCMLSSYLYALIVQGYTISPQQEINFLPLNKSADWTIGVVLHHRKHG